MRRQRPPSEIVRLAAPVARLVDGAWRRMHWWVATMALLYAVSGITVVRADEVAVILRWGRLVGATPALQQHGPGLLFSFPRPMDQVIRVPVKHVGEMSVNALIRTTDEAGGEASYDPYQLNPVRQGYALTGDQNVVQVDMVARYRVRDPVDWAFFDVNAEDVLRVEVTAAMVRSLGEMGVDRVLSDGRKFLIATATRRAQMGLDDAHSGLELSSLEVTRLGPPVALANDFDAVQSAFIAAETARKQAQAFAETEIPQAQAAADSATQTARGAADAEMAVARGSTDAFIALAREYRANPVVVRERLYREAIERAIAAAGKVQWVPPPDGGSYRGFRISIQPAGVGSQPAQRPPCPACGEEDHE